MALHGYRNLVRDPNVGKRRSRDQAEAVQAFHRAVAPRHFANQTELQPIGTRSARTPQKFLTDSQNALRDIESLLIHALGTIQVGNGRGEIFVAAAAWEQVRWAERADYSAKVTCR